MQGDTFISVILPLRLEWEPVYRSLPEAVPGARVEVVFSRRQYTGVVSAVLSPGELPSGMDPSKIQPALSLSPLPPVSGREIEFWREVSSYYLCTIGEVYKVAYPAIKTSLEKTKKAAKERAALHERRTAVSPSPEALPRISLAPAQQEAKEGIAKAFSKGKTALLQGVTGSGKTEIYLSLAADCLRGGRSVLLLVPEIALSRQLEDRIRARFGDSLLVFHSGLPGARRREVASSLREGPGIVLGTRSALFLPFIDLGLIVVDEEHDTSYKQDSPAPRYNARDAAAFLARIHGSHLLLGSATPSAESLYNASSGRFDLVTLGTRYYEGGEARIEIIDTRAEKRKNGMVGSLSRKLIAHMQDALSGGGQVLLLRSRRAYSPSVQCEACGEIPRCPRCDVPLSFHADSGRLSCHYCGYSRPAAACPSCGGKLLPVGAGTQRIEEEVAALFPDYSVARLDGDSARDAEQARRIIKDFQQGRTDILIGTQMVSKGFDFEGLTLVAVIGADSLLGLQDFRADEKALQLLSQLRGRSGRRGQKSLFVVQTSRSEHPVYRLFAGGEGGDFLSQRREFGYPPFTRIVDIVFRDPSSARADKLSQALAQRICGLWGISPSFGPSGAGSVSLLGPFSPVISKVSNSYIRAIRIFLPKDRELSARKQALRSAVLDFGRDYSCEGRVTLDVDPA